MNPARAFRLVVRTVCASTLFALGHLPTHADSPLVFNEIMYHPATNEAALEWVELQNQHGVDLDLSGWRLDGGIAFTFPEGTIVRAGDFLVVASAPASLAAATGLTNIAGPFTDRLANSGETLRLRNNNGRVLDELAYGVEGDWPVAPDGAGPSLARRQANTATRDSQNWQASAQTGGTPGRENFPVPPPSEMAVPRVAPVNFVERLAEPRDEELVTVSVPLFDSRITERKFDESVALPSTMVLSLALVSEILSVSGS